MENFPPFRREAGGLEHEFWVGSRDFYAPQLLITQGPSLAELRKALETNAAVELAISSRTADMEEDEPDDVLGDVTATVGAIYEQHEGVVCFLAHIIRSLPGNPEPQNRAWTYGDELWAWDYDGQTFYTGADFRI